MEWLQSNCRPAAGCKSMQVASSCRFSYATILLESKSTCYHLLMVFLGLKWMDRLALAFTWIAEPRMTWIVASRAFATTPDWVSQAPRLSEKLAMMGTTTHHLLKTMSNPSQNWMESSQTQKWDLHNPTPESPPFPFKIL